MRQYFDLKAGYPDTILFFQVGDFYELFFDDATRISAQIGLTLTQRGTHEGKPIPLCGVPCHVIEHYLSKLMKLGYRVALCDQLEEAQPGKLVARGVTQVLSPALLTQATLLESDRAAYLAAVVSDGHGWGVAHFELMTGLLQATCVIDKQLVLAELARFKPQEIIVSEAESGWLARQGYMTTQVVLNDGSYAPQCSDQRIMRNVVVQEAVNNIYAYLHKYQPHAVVACVRYYDPTDFMVIDAATQRNLELIEPAYADQPEHALVSVLDDTVTSMGARLLKKWVAAPLVDIDEIKKRQAHVARFVAEQGMREGARRSLTRIGDLERIAGRVALRRATLSDYRMLTGSLEPIVELGAYDDQLAVCRSGCSALLDQLAPAFAGQEAPEGWRIAAGYCAELDLLRAQAQRGSDAILAYERAEQERLGISTLKVRYHAQQGYAIELTRAHSAVVPDGYTRIQSLTNKERFTSDALRLLVQRIAEAEAAAARRENELFLQLEAVVFAQLSLIKRMSERLAELDVFQSYATIALKNGYICPNVVSVGKLVIRDGRHPVVERSLEQVHARFVPNDVSLGDDERVWVITGPNMGGKSTFLRQVALIVIMAHMGSFVPAREAQIPIVDRIFTRIGSADHLALGKSTFLVEMEETALLCHQATQRSLVILDEIGRGTSTTDGLAIAQAVVEYLYHTVQAKTLFATHYRELAALGVPGPAQLPALRLYHAAAVPTQAGGEVVLVHRILAGVAAGSFGISVARTARLPEAIIARAQQLVGE